MMFVGMEETVQKIREDGGKCWSYYCDITNREEVYRVAKTVQIEVGSVSVHCTSRQKLRNYSEEYRKVIMKVEKTNLF